MRQALSSVLVVAVLVWAAHARAWCRTRTTHETLGYDPSAAGCWTQGVPVAWPPGRVTYSVSIAASRQVPLADAKRVASRAFQAWNGASCNGHALAVQAYEGAPADASVSSDCGLADCGQMNHDETHVIVFDDDAWPHNDPNNTLALTTVTYGVDTGTIYDADIEVDSHDHVLTTTEPPPPDAFDLQAILTHEAGHFLGLSHSQFRSAIMYAHYRPGAIALTQDDIEGVCSVYTPPPQPVCGCRSSPDDSWRESAWAIAAAAFVIAAVRLRGARAPRRDTRSRRPSAATP